MQTSRLADDFVNPDAERALLASLAERPDLYQRLSDRLHPDLFPSEPDAWDAIEAGRPPNVPLGWAPSDDPEATTRQLADLHQRRLLADLQERLAAGLYDPDRPAQELAALLALGAANARLALSTADPYEARSADELVSDVLRMAEERRRAVEAGGHPEIGVRTRIAGLDKLLGGLGAGLYVLSGAPGAGKTTLALQLAMTAAGEGVPAIYVTFENSPPDLVLKAIATRAGINPGRVARGGADLEALRRAAAAWGPVAARLILIPGGGRLAVDDVRATALDAMRRPEVERCLVVVDYLQLWAKLSSELRGLSSVRERVEVLGGHLRELATGLASPVLAVCSQNRDQGKYGKGNGSAALDSLKESGDLEYAADVVLFLTGSKRQATPPAVAVDLTVAKHRNGATGRVNLIFRPDLGTMLEEGKP